IGSMTSTLSRNVGLSGPAFPLTQNSETTSSSNMIFAKPASAETRMPTARSNSLLFRVSPLVLPVSLRAIAVAFHCLALGRPLRLLPAAAYHVGEFAISLDVGDPLLEVIRIRKAGRQLLRQAEPCFLGGGTNPAHNQVERHRKRHHVDPPGFVDG